MYRAPLHLGELSESIQLHPSHWPRQRDWCRWTLWHSRLTKRDGPFTARCFHDDMARVS